MNPADAFDAQRLSEPAGSVWKPLPAAEVAADLARLRPHYIVRALIGHGGMGAVYAADDLDLTTAEAEAIAALAIAEPERIHRLTGHKVGRRVAIKLLRPDKLHDSDYVLRFAREVRGHKALGREDKHIMPCMGDGATLDGYPYYVMPLLEGSSLADHLRDPARPPLHRIVRYMEQIGIGADHMHAHGWFHRDLKAANIYIVADGDRAFILDLGVARDAATPSTLTGSGGNPGTYGHIAPELLPPTSAAATPFSEVYSLTALFNNMLAGKIPAIGEPPSYYGFPQFDEVWKKGLFPEPAQRYPSANALAQAIKEAAETPRVAKQPANSSPPPLPVAPVVRTIVPPQPVPNALKNSTPPVIKEIVVSPDPNRLKQHREYLGAGIALEKSSQSQSSSISQNEKWHVIDQWDAMPDLPSDGEVKKAVDARRTAKIVGTVIGFCLAVIIAISVGAAGGGGLGVLGVAVIGGAFMALMGWGLGNGFFEKVISPVFMSHAPAIWQWGMNTEDFVEQGLVKNPKQIFWHPKRPHIYVYRDHQNAAGWRWKRTTDYNGIMKSDNSQLSGRQKVFSAGHVERVFFGNNGFLVKSESFWWWNANTHTHSLIVYDENGRIACEISSSIGDAGLLAPQGNPCRPTSYGSEFLTITPYGQMCLCDVASMPKWFGISHFDDCKKLVSLAKAVVNLSNVRLSESERVLSFAWHPSGLYLAIEVGGRLHIIHWDSAEQIAAHQLASDKKFDALGWSPDGLLLALDKEAKRVWDARTAQIRVTTAYERWPVLIDGALENKLTSCDGERRFSGQPGVEINANFPGAGFKGVKDAAWSPDDPHIFATIGGENCPRDIRIWQKVG